MPDGKNAGSLNFPPRRLLQAAALAALLGAAASLCAFKLLDRDFWAHITAGEIMLRTHALIRMEPFAYTRAGLPYTSTHEWLAEIALHLIYHFGGAAGIILWRTAMMALTFLLLLRIDPAGLWPNGLLAVWAAAAARPGFIERPQLFTYAIFSAFLLLAYRALEAGWKITRNEPSGASAPEATGEEYDPPRGPPRRHAPGAGWKMSQDKTAAGNATAAGWKTAGTTGAGGKADAIAPPDAADAARRRRRRIFWSLAALQALWVNLHGGACVLGLFVAGALIIQEFADSVLTSRISEVPGATLVDKVAPAGRREDGGSTGPESGHGWFTGRKMGLPAAPLGWGAPLCLIAVLAASFVSPNGLSNASYLHRLLTDRTIALIPEWRPRGIAAYWRDLGPLWVAALLSLIFGAWESLRATKSGENESPRAAGREQGNASSLAVPGGTITTRGKEQGLSSGNGRISPPGAAEAERGLSSAAGRAENTGSVFGIRANGALHAVLGGGRLFSILLLAGTGRLSRSAFRHEMLFVFAATAVIVFQLKHSAAWQRLLDYFLARGEYERDASPAAESVSSSRSGGSETSATRDFPVSRPAAASRQSDGPSSIAMPGILRRAAGREYAPGTAGKVALLARGAGPRIASALTLGLLVALGYHVRAENLSFGRRDHLYGYGTFDLARGAADFIEREGVAGNMFNTYGIGGYLIYRDHAGRNYAEDMDAGSHKKESASDSPVMPGVARKEALSARGGQRNNAPAVGSRTGGGHAGGRESGGSGAESGGLPRRPVFIDGRNVDYGYDFMARAFFAGQDPEAWRQLEDRWHITYAIIDYDAIKQDGPLPYCGHLGKNPDWKLAYVDDWAAVYLKDIPENRAIIGRNEYRLVTPELLERRREVEEARAEDLPALAAELGRVVAGNPDGIKGRLALSRLYLRNQDWGRARAPAEDAYRLQPLRPEVHEALAAVDAAQGRWAKAGQGYEEALRLAGDSYPRINYAYIGEVFAKAGDIRKAKKYLAKAGLTYTVETAESARASASNPVGPFGEPAGVIDLANAAGQSGDSHGMNDKSSEAGPRSSAPNAKGGSTDDAAPPADGKSGADGKSDDAASPAAQAADKARPSMSGTGKNKKGKERGVKKEEEEKGRKLAERIAREDADDIDGFNARGIAFAEKGKLDEAEAEFMKALPIDPGNPRTCNNLGSVYFQKRGFEKAIGFYRRALERSPDYADAHYNLAMALRHAGRYDEAREEARKAGKLGKDVKRILAAVDRDAEHAGPEGSKRAASGAGGASKGGAKAPADAKQNPAPDAIKRATRDAGKPVAPGGGGTP